VKRALLVAAALVVLGAGVAAVYAYNRYQAGEDVHGSSSVEFSTNEVVPKSSPRNPIRWPTFGFDVARRHWDEGLGLEPPFRAVWTFKARKLIEFPPALGYRRLFVQTNDGRLIALDRRFGKVHWSTAFHRCSAASPTLSDYTVYAAFMNTPPCNASGDKLNGVLIALRVRDGKERWRFSRGPSETSPLVVDGRVYVGDWRGNVYALDQHTGKLLWTYSTGGA